MCVFHFHFEIYVLLLRGDGHTLSPRRTHQRNCHDGVAKHFEFASPANRAVEEEEGGVEGGENAQTGMQHRDAVPGMNTRIIQGEVLWGSARDGPPFEGRWPMTEPQGSAMHRLRRR